MAGNQNKNWIKIDTVIAQYMDEAEVSDHKKFKLFQIAVRGVENLGLDFFYQVKSALLPVNSNHTVFLPDDFVSYSKVGLFDGAGNVFQLYRNDRLPQFSNAVNTYYDANAPYFYNYWDDGVCGNYYCGGLPYSSGSFKIDNGLMLLSPTQSFSYILLEYVASPEQAGEYFIPLQFREALIAWIGWRDGQNMPSSRKGGLGEKRDKKSEFYNQRRLAIARYKPFNLGEAWELSNRQLNRVV